MANTLPVDDKIILADYDYTWMIPVSKRQAREIFLKGQSVYRLYDKDKTGQCSEGEIDSLEEIEEHNCFGIERKREKH